MFTFIFCDKMRIDRYTLWCMAIFAVSLSFTLVCADPIDYNPGELTDQSSTEHPKDLRDLSKEKLRTFYSSFDTVIADLDDTIWQSSIPISGAIASIETLKKCGKEILFVTNNSVFPKEKLVKILMALGYNATLTDVVSPSEALVWHLRKTNFQGTAFVIGSTNFIETLRQNNIPVINGQILIAERLNNVVELLSDLDKDVKAVICEFDINVNYAKLIEAAEHIKRNDVDFFAGSLDRKLTLSRNFSLIGNSYFVDILTEHTGRVPMGYAKPSTIMRNYLSENHVKSNPMRTLFIGDSLRTDMTFAEMSGYQRLWVRSGLDGSTPCEDGCQGKPHYYLPDLGKMPHC